MSDNRAGLAFWTKDKIAALTKGIADKKSATELGMELGTSRNAVIGKALRLKLHFDSWRGGRRAVRKRQPPIPGFLARPAVTRREAAPPPPIPTPQPLPQIASVMVAAEPCAGDLTVPDHWRGAPLAVLRLKPHGECRFPFGDAKSPDFRFCCAPAESIYCAEHTKLTTTKGWY